MRSKFFISLFLLMSIIAYSQEEEKPRWSVRWNQGAEIKSSDGNFKFKFGGRIQFDVMNIWQNPSLSNEFDAQNGAEFRRLRWYTSGTLYRNIKFKLQFDFSAGDAGVKDAYIEIIKIPVVGNFRVGHFKQPFGLEMQTSSKYIEFMERGLTNAFTPERDIGFMIFNTQFNKRFAWYIGYFYPNGSIGKYQGDQYRVTARLAGQPIYQPEGRYTVLHLGAAYENQFQDNLQGGFSERPEAHMAPKYVNLNMEAVNRANVFGAEFAFVSGRFAVQSEYMIASVMPTDTAAVQFTSYNYYAVYGIFSFFLTGEHRNYNQSKTCFDIVVPKKNLGKGGYGAWEMVFRVSHIDLNDHDLKGGAMTDFTFGLNWYLNPATRVAFNYIYSDVFDTGYANIAMIRFYVAF